VTITEKTAETAIISISQYLAEGFRLCRNRNTTLDITEYDIRKTPALNSIIKKSFIIFAVKTPAAH
jgi:hypothetical protein